VRLNLDNTAIVLDSTADRPDVRDRPNWRVVPLYVRFGDDIFRDYVDMQPAEFYARLRATTEQPRSSQPSPGDFADAAAELDGYDRILVLPISSGLSGTYESARAAAEADPSQRLRVFDTRFVSGAIALLAEAVQRRLARGTDDAEIDALVARYKKDAGLLFTVDTLEFLQKGGRIGRAAAFAGNLLHVKPILTIADGEVLPLKRVRGNQKAVQEFARGFEGATTDSPSLRVGIAAADAPDRIETLRALVAATRPSAQIEIATTLGPVVGTHAGPGTVGFFWFDDPD
jgi:DegV family protein with EDD domain